VESIFILGHMRSRSSLLAHVILNNRTFVGMGESNATYTGFGRLRYMKLKSLGVKGAASFFSRHFVDQINHNIKTPNWDLLMSPKIKLIVLVRNPIDSISSIMRLTEQHYSAWSYEKSSSYYLDRIAYLSKVCEQKNKEDLLVLNSDALITETDKSLNQVAKFLTIDSGLNHEYEARSFTGVKGDPNEKIFSGKILKDETISMKFKNQDDAPSIQFMNFIERYIQ